MRLSNLDEVLAIERQSFPNPWTRSAFASHLQHPEFARYFVARFGDGGKIVGYVGLFFSHEQGQLTNLAVDPSYRRQGIAKRLLLTIFEYAQEIGLYSLTLEVRVSNYGAQELYRKFGFILTGTRKGYYQESGEDALVMCLFNISGPEQQKRLEEIKEEIARQP